MFQFNSMYLLLIIPAVFAWLAQSGVRKTYAKYAEVRNSRGLSGSEIARRLLTHNELDGIKVVKVRGSLTDHYNPRDRTLSLSEEVINGNSVMSLGVVAHEVAHVVQYREDYPLIRLRERLAGLVGTLAQLSPLVFIGGMILGITSLLALGGLMLGAQAVFALVTLPVERNASTRAITMLEQAGLSQGEESRNVRRVLRAAALTYLAALGRQVATFLFFVLVIGAAGGRRIIG